MSAQIGSCLISGTAVKVERLRPGRSRSPRAAELVEAQESSREVEEVVFRQGLTDEGPWALEDSRQVQMRGVTGRVAYHYEHAQQLVGVPIDLLRTWRGLVDDNVKKLRDYQASGAAPGRRGTIALLSGLGSDFEVIVKAGDAASASGCDADRASRRR